MSVKAVLFDHDGVLADSESVFFLTTRDAFALADIDLRPQDWGRLYLGEGGRSTEVAVALGLPPTMVRDVIDTRNKMFQQRLAEGIALRRGAQKTIEALRGLVRMAIVTGCPRSQIEAIHGSTEFLKHFEYIVTADDCERAKPHPESYVKAVRHLGLSPQECLAVEDSPRGLAAAAAAGLRCVLVPTELTDLSLCGSAWKTFADIAQIVPLIEEANRGDS